MPQNYHPLLFTFRDMITGNGFLSGITLNGRCLLVEEGESEWWMYGVRPGAIAATGKTAQETLQNFRNKYREVLFDIAGEYEDFASFKNGVEEFFYQPDREEEHRWEEAVRKIRSQNIQPPVPLAQLPHEAPEGRPTQITIERLDGANKRFMPSDNVPDKFLLPMAA